MQEQRSGQSALLPEELHPYTIRNEWIEKNPFRFYKMKIDKTNVKVSLTKAELTCR